jgi:hypothetical protein
LTMQLIFSNQHACFTDEIDECRPVGRTFVLGACPLS